ncbi:MULTISPECIES: two-component system VirA-like sensor kinase [unclassified Sinorhizobium]|uniref:two-component system VirA-like sensor kinase n=1 Tax=unclassified Sinorhizobium TaxID=2613772 RepID=UPI0024C45126|nr:MULTISPECIES: two-component system VirA-like sensor kinase [unclassified Sinorhizobium]MDK1374121.1 two-component system VirA-like sensor kinase [Sinorhizobium sp. 6-70]MDK1477862.1 two-component system VirA-like sensor kinase [Sinorhizobium sp. 6-117]
MRRLHALALVVAGLFIVLTYFLFQGLAPDTPHRQRADALQTVILHSAALQRDVLRARAGLLRSYDPLVQSMESLLAATAALPAIREVARGETKVEIDRKLSEVTAAVRDQEALVEIFKSQNAVLQNSLAYFNHLSGRLAAATVGQRTELNAEIGALTAAMLRFTNAPQSGAAAEVERSLDRIATLPVDAALAEDVRSLIAHAGLVVTALPAVDDLVARVQSAPTSGRTQALQDVYFAAYERAAARADLFLRLLYVAALALVAYVAYLFVRLRANAQTLKQRLGFEALIASISTHFINLPREEIRAAIGEALARLVEFAGLDGAQIIVVDDGGPDLDGSYWYRRQALGTANAPPTEVADLVLNWRPEGYELDGCICVPDVGALADSRQKASLMARHVRSWLTIPMRVAGKPLGVLGLEATAGKKHWRDDDIALIRTAAEIFANAIARERGEAEREALQARLYQSQRLEAIGTLAGGIAHEFNNILGAIRGYSEMALAVLLKESRARRYLEQIMKAGERAQDVIEQVLAFGRRRERQLRPIGIVPVVAEAIDLVRASLPATLAVRTRLEAEGVSVMGDATELQQVIMNLCANAAQAMEGRGTLTLVVDTVDAKNVMKLSHGSLPARRYVRITVRDTGRGIDRAALERIFEPFFTTKPAGQGTGLGLSTVHGIVGGHGGALNVKSRPGEGATFEVYLPRTEDAAPKADRPPEPPLRTGQGETILIVDDEKPLVLLGEEMLAALGYEPVGFDGGLAALAAFRTKPTRFDLVLVDEVMAEMTGTEFADAIRALRPDIPIVLMTGYTHTLRPDRLQATGISEVLKKPLLSRALADCLARQLASG